MVSGSAYEIWTREHAGNRKGERLRRLKEGHGHAEKLFAESVWWPAFTSYDRLHPEYEVSDFKDGSRYLDFAYIREGAKVCIEIDGYGPHRRDADRRQFSDELTRQNHLVIDGWIVIRFTYDDVKERPRHCQQLLQQLFGKLFGDRNRTGENLSILEKEAIRLAYRQNGKVAPGELFHYLGIGRTKGSRLIADLIDKKWFIPASGNRRICLYRLNGDRPLTF
ncbi:DNA-binding response regulator [Paenibacillus hemerocallicola]|uniref:DNA-binding response regulator n=1 Tax=Paenibacillus hemerocallicola TaxID=1172614 RepID=A0A5C4TE68_9BACL|nr:DNA-binding response regulator [Paenibacillus hemerocallicola]TNJ67318.1 DNA-binding response regulator [Paenibacillus hemerocallicola]